MDTCIHGIPCIHGIHDKIFFSSQVNIMLKEIHKKHIDVMKNARIVIITVDEQDLLNTLRQENER